jgi:predicted phage terminase large subunit-like protein
MNNIQHIPTALKKKVFNHALREDFCVFLRKAFQDIHGVQLDWNWHHEVICDDLMAAYRGEERRLIINVPPRSLKSFICSIAFPAWLMGRNPRMKIIGVSYAQDLASKFSREQRMLMMQPWYQEVFPNARINPKKAGEAEFEVIGGGFRLATSCGGVLTGRGADLIIIDDPIKPQDALSETMRTNANNWIDSTLMTRLDDKQRGIMIMIMQRLHEEDSTGHLLEKGGWIHRSFPSIALDDEHWQISSGQVYRRKAGELLHPVREPQQVLDDLRRDLGQMHFSAQYQQMPVPFDGNMLNKGWFSYYVGVCPLQSQRFVMSVDTAMKEGANNDWTVITIWQMEQQAYYLVHLTREKMAFPKLHATIRQLKEIFKVRTILIEDTGSGTALIQQLRFEKISCHGVKPIGDKIERLAAASIAFEQRRVHFPADASWLPDLERELLGFPATKHDDQVDSVSQFLNWALTDGRYFVGSGRTTGYY